MRKIFNIRNIPIVVAIIVVLLSVGYSAFGTSLNISDIAVNVRVEADIRLTGISVDSYTSNAVSSYENYNVSNISTNINLPNSDSTITYKVSVTNFGNAEMGIFAINNLPSNLEYELIDYNLHDKICNNSQCSLGVTKEFYITIKYNNGGYNSGNTNYALNLEFDFRPYYTVMYEGIINNGYPTEVISGGDLVVNFIEDVPNVEIRMDGIVIDENSYTFDSKQNYLLVPDVSGNVIVTYTDPTLITILLNKYEEGATSGLVQDETNPNIYYYTGTNEQVSNNFLWYGGHHWRVVEFDTSDNTLLLVSQQPLTNIQPASSPWDTQEEYENSYINDWLNDYFYNSLDSEIQNNIVNNTFNVGIYSDVDEITLTQKVGLLDQGQYERAGSADSYLNIKDNFWLGNRYSSSYFRYVSSSGSLLYYSTSDGLGVRAVIKISDITITGGDGTLSSNYKTADKATNTSDVQVGEYINVPYIGSDNACGADNLCTFRVVSKDNDSIKVVLNGLLPNTSLYGSNSIITTSHRIYTQLNTFANNISSDYRYTGNKIFYIGDYPRGTDFKDVQDETLQASVGLPIIGEIFSGNDIDLGTSSTKTFVDINTIENPTAKALYWLMNRFNSSYVRYISSNGQMSNNSPTTAYGVRPVIYLKSGPSALTFTGGEGTAESPYTLS